MQKQPFMPLFVGDFFASTAEWEGEEESLYLSLLARQWALGSLPTDTEKLARLVRWSTKNFEKYWQVVKLKFEERDGRLYNERLESHRDRAAQISDLRAKSGSLGGATTAARLKQNGSKQVASAAASAGANAEILPGHPIQSNPNHPIQDLQSSNSSPASPPEGADVVVTELKLTGESEVKKGPPNCPHEQIVHLYHTVLPELPKVLALNNTRRRQMTSLWRGAEKRQNLAYWKQYFEFIRGSDWLMGRVKPSPGRSQFIADIDFLIDPSKFLKINEEKYHRG